MPQGMNYRPLKEWQPKKRFSHKDNAWHLAFAHKSSLRGKNCRTRNLLIVLLYQRWFTKHLFSGLSYEEFIPFLGVTVCACYVENQLNKWFEQGYLKREPSVNPKTHKLVYLYCVGERGKHLVNDIIPQGKLAEYIQVLLDAHRLLEVAQKEAPTIDPVK
jgi:hypothetical protein